MLSPDEIPTIVRGSRALIPPHVSSDGGQLSRAQILMEKLMRREDPHPALKLLSEPPPDETIMLPERVTPTQGDRPADQASSGKDLLSQKSAGAAEGYLQALDKRLQKDRLSPAIRHARFGRQPTTPPRSGRLVAAHFPRRTVSMTPVLGSHYRREAEQRAPTSPVSTGFAEARHARPPSPGNLSNNNSSANNSDTPDNMDEVPSSSRSTKSPRSSIESPAPSPAAESPMDRTPPRPEPRAPAPMVRAFPTNNLQPRRGSSNEPSVSPAVGMQRGGSQYLSANRSAPTSGPEAPERHPPPRSPSGDLEKLQGRVAWSPDRRLTSPHGVHRTGSAPGPGTPAPAAASTSGPSRLHGHAQSGVFLASPAGRVSLNAVSSGPIPRAGLTIKASFPTNATPIAATTNALRGSSALPTRSGSPFSRPNAGGILRGPTGAARPPEPTMIISPTIAQYSSLYGASGYA